MKKSETPYQRELAAVAAKEAELKAIRARLAEADARTETARRQIEMLSSVAGRHSETDEARTARRHASADAEVLRAQEQAAELSLVRSEMLAQTELERAWTAIAKTARAELLESVAVLGNKAWIAENSSGSGSIPWRDFMVNLASDAEAIIHGRSTGEGMMSAPTGVDLPQAFAGSSSLAFPRRRELRSVVLMEAMAG